MNILLLLILPIALFVFAYLRVALIIWTLTIGLYIFAWAIQLNSPTNIISIIFIIYVLIAALFNIKIIRRRIITASILNIYRRILPPMSQTEREALEAGSVWWEGELFQGKPNWQTLLDYPQPKLSEEEQKFLDQETDELCRISDDWESSHLLHDLPQSVWHYMCTKGFLGMIIPKQYGGLGFSAYAHSQIVTKLATRCSATAVSVMVPNSLGPAELLLHYGTEEQKNYYLPRLAKGTEIPAFALTSPWAGSDAAAIPDHGIVCKGVWQGKEILGMRVTWDKRYITLAPVCTVFGLAFRLYDPDHLLGHIDDIGITCALVPNTHPGVAIGRRHFPLNAVWHNGPIHGKDVFMPLDFIIGGPQMAGQGWRMLMECLAAGRSISLPGSNTGMQKLAVRTTGAYARIRTQFKTPIGKFEGIQEPLARMAGHLYLSDAARILTAGAVDLGEKPSVVSAIAKYHVTELTRQSINDAMDILGGKGICLGPNNFMGRIYQQIPIGITVEGANILTRSLIIFGQGAIRCHPYVLREMRAAQNPDHSKGLEEFDDALFAHIGYTLSNGVRAFIMGLTGSHFVRTPQSIAPQTRRYYQQLSRFCAAFSFMADIAMLVMGGDLKRKEKLSARLGDILSLMYLASAVLKRFEVEGRQEADAPIMHWAIWNTLFKAQSAFEGVISNFPNKFIANILKRVLFPLGRPYVIPSDQLGAQVADLLIAPSATRDRLTQGMYLPIADHEIVNVIERALTATIHAEQIEARIHAARKAGTLHGHDIEQLVEAAFAQNIISAEEHAHMLHTRTLKQKVIQVDDFPPDFGLQASGTL